MGQVLPMKPEVAELIAAAKERYDKTTTKSAIRDWVNARAIVEDMAEFSKPEDIRRKMSFAVDLMVTRIINGEFKYNSVGDAIKVMEACAKLAANFEFAEIGDLVDSVKDPESRKRLMSELRSKAAAANSRAGGVVE